MVPAICRNHPQECDFHGRILRITFALSILAKPHDDRVIAIWLLSFIIWAAIIRWWMVAGALGGSLFYQPHLHDFDITGRILNVAFGAIMVVHLR